MAFNHLHQHSEFSLLDGAQSVNRMVEIVSNFGHEAVALTDHGWMAGAVKLVKACKKVGIKPIIGCEAYVTTTSSMTDKAKSSGDNFHITLLARNREGYGNLSHLTTSAYLDGLSFKPRIDLPLLMEYSGGITLLSGCVGAQLPQTIIYRGMKEAKKLVEFYVAVFGENFWIEIMSHLKKDGTELVQFEGPDGEIIMGQGELNDALADLAGKYGVGMVATNDAHYACRADGCAHDTILALGVGSWKGAEKRLRFPGTQEDAVFEFFMKSEREMRKASKAKYWQEACDNTVLVANSISADCPIEFGDTILPDFVIDDDELLALRVWEQTGEFL